MPKKHVATDEAPQPIGPYSQAVVAGGFLFVSGQVPIDPATGELVEGDIALQTERVMRNLLAILRQAKMGPEHVVKTTIYLVDLADFARVNEVYGRHFGDHRPARAAVAVKELPKGGLVEIDCIAELP